MAVAFVSASNSSSAAAATSNSFSYDATGVDFLIAFLLVGSGSFATPSVTYNSVSMTAVSGSPWLQSGAVGIAAFYLAAPTTGSNTLAASWTGSGKNNLNVIGMSGGGSVSSVQQTGSAGASTLTRTVVSTANGLVVSAGGVLLAGGMAFTGNTTDWNQGNGNFVSGGGHAAGGVSVTAQWDSSGGSDVMIMTAFSIDPPVTGRGSRLALLGVA